MDKKNIVKYEDRLKNLKKEEIARGERIEEGLRTSLQDSIDELSLYDNHPADIADTTFARELDLGLKLFSQEKVAMIDDALDSIEEGTYGICEECGRHIDNNRLEAVPYTTLCQECKRENEMSVRDPRPVEEDVIKPPFGSVEDEDKVNFDGEDTWQAVARYGTSNSPSDIGSISDYNEVYVNSAENIGLVEDYEGIAVHKKKDGQLYGDFNGEDDEKAPFNWSNE